MAIPQLVLGSFNLTDWAGAAYRTAVMAQGTSKGAPVPLETAVKSWLQDGSIVVTQGYDNRTVNLRVSFRAASLTAVAQAEAAFFAELGKPNTLTWTPATGPAAVFVVVTSSMEESPGDSGDLAENQAFPWRTYNVRLLCEAFTRSVAEITVAALAASGTTTTLVDDGSATTNWTGTINGVSSSPSVVSGAVGLTSASVSGTTTLSLTRTASITTSSTKYLVIDWRPTTGSYIYLNPYMDFDVFADGTQLAQISTVAVTASLYRTTVLATTASIAALRIDLLVRQGSSTSGNQVRTLFIDNINRTDVRPSLGTSRQQLRTVPLTGSAPTQGSLDISHATNALGDMLAYTWVDVDGAGALYVPAGRPFAQIVGTEVTDSAMVSGVRNSLTVGAQVEYRFPSAALPAGSYLIMARAATAAGSFTASVSALTWTEVNSATIDPGVTIAVSQALTTTYSIFPLGRASLPSVSVRDPATSTVKVRFTNVAGGSIRLDEVWLFNTTIGQLVWVDCGTAAPSSGGTSRRVVIEPANQRTPRPVVLRGFATDASDAYAWNIKAWGQPRFTPPTANLFFVTSNTTDADASYRYFPRWHTNPAS